MKRLLFASLLFVMRFPAPGQHRVPDITLSKEPPGPLSPQSDPQFADAGEHGITSQNINAFPESDNPASQRLPGQNGNAAGSCLGIANDCMVQVIRQTGNYAEIFRRNLTVPPFNLERGINALWTDGGLMYAPPFR